MRNRRNKRNGYQVLIVGALAAYLLAGCGNKTGEPQAFDGSRPAEEPSVTETLEVDTKDGGPNTDKQEEEKETSQNDGTKAPVSSSQEDAQVLEEGRIIAGQTFDINLDGWGEVRFVSYAPAAENPREDVEFYLTKDGRILYEFPDPWDGGDADWTFESVDMVSFPDVNQDGKKDVIALISYITGAGPQAAVPFPTTRIFLAEDGGFVPDQELAGEIDEQKANDSIETIMKYLAGRSSSGKEESESAADPMYEVTGIKERDARAFLETFLAHVNADEKEAAAEMILYPKRVFFPGKEVTVSSAEEFLPYYDEIFTEDYKKRINEAMDEDLFWNYMGVMLGNGEIWIQESEGALGISAVNNGEERGAVYPGEGGVQPG